MSGLIPVHPSITEMSERDRERLYLDDAPRWVGPTAPTTRDSETARFLLEHYARRLADAVVDGEGDEWLMDCRRRDYVEARARHDRMEQLERDTIYARGAEGFAGWIVRAPSVSAPPV